jgi:hypothetical protein
VLGEKELQKYLVNEIQEVYRLQGVNINDKHLEVISRQMMRWVKIEDIGDTEFLPEEVVDKFKFREDGSGGTCKAVLQLLQLIRNRSYPITRNCTLTVTPDPDDNKFSRMR